MARPSPSAFVQSWVTGTQGASAKYTAGVQGSNDWATPTVNALPTMIANLQAAYSSGSIQRGIESVGTAGWRNATLAKANNWLTGVSSQMAQTNMLNAVQNKLYPMIDAGLGAIANTPRGTYEQNRTRLITYLDAAHAYAQTNF